MSVLDPHPDDRPIDHAAFLLYCMQDPLKCYADKRSINLTARALNGISDATIRRKLFRARKWEERIQEYGVGVDGAAWRQYSERYLATIGVDPIRRLAPYMQVDPLAPTPEAAARMARTAAEAADDGDLSQMVLQAALDLQKSAVEEGPTERRQFLENAKATIEGALGYIVEGLEKKRVSASVRDLLPLIEAYQGMIGFDGIEESAGPRESVRVRLARDAGEDVLEALREDIAELDLITGLIAQKRDQDEEHEIRAKMDRLAMKERIEAQIESEEE